MPLKKDTRTKILDAALELFSEKGFKATTTKAIAEKAEINEVTLFRNFESKEKLFLAIIDRETMIRLNIIQMELEPSENIVDELAMIGSFMAKNMVKKASFFRLMVLEVNLYPLILDHIETVPMAAIDMLSQYFEKAKKSDLVRKDIDSKIMAVSFFSYLFRILVTNAFLGEDIFMKKHRDGGMRNFADIFVNGVRSD